MSVTQEYIKQLCFQNRVVSWQQSLYVPRKIKRARHLQKLTLSIMPLNHRLKYTNSFFFLFQEERYLGGQGYTAQKLPAEGNPLPDSLSQPGRRKAVWACMGKDSRFLVPRHYTKTAGLWRWEVGTREDEGGRLEGWETGVGTLQGMTIKSHSGKGEDASLSPLFPPALY